MATTPAPRVSTPRGRFIQVPSNLSSHRRILDNPDFQKSVDVALLEYTRAIVSLSGELDSAGAQQAAAACFHLISGAHQFLEVFNRLADPAVPPSAPQSIESLIHTNK